MDLAITDFVKRSAEIAFGATKGSLKDYGKNVGELVSASKDIKDKLMPEVKNAKQAFSSMKRSGPISSISNWFYSKEYEIGDSDDMLNDTDEFDSGNPNLNDDSGDSSSTVLDAGTAKGLARSQVSAMYRIGSKQTEASVANTAEIISNMSQRSADMIAAINNVNSTLINISNKMDNLITLLSPQQGVQDVNHSSIYDSSGRLSLSSISSALGNRASSTFGSSRDMVGMLKRAFTPEEIFRMTVVDRVFSKNLNALGGRSIDDMGKAFNKASGDAIQSILNTALQNTPLGDFLLRGNRKSFADVSSQNQYTKDAAVFDKATRHTIVSIIPEYLKKITEAVTGQKWNIDERGTVTTKTVANPFKQAGAAILGANINYDSMNRLDTTIQQYSNQKISSQDQSAAVNALLIVYILQEKYNNPRQVIDANQINNMFLKSPNRREYTDLAVNIFVQNSMISDRNKARNIINTVWTYLATDKELARSFAQAVNSNYDKMYQAGKTIDANNPLAYQYANDSSISYDDMLSLVKSANVKGMLQYESDYEAKKRELEKQYGKHSTIGSMRINSKLQEWDRENRSKYLKNEEEEVTSRIGQANVAGRNDNSFFAQQKKLFASLTKYTHGIYDILNSGVVNVRMVGQPVRRAVRNHREVRVSSSFGNGGSSSSEDGGGADEPPQPSTDTPQPLPILPTAGYTGEMSASERAFNAAMGYGSQATTTVRNFLSGGPVGVLRNEISNIGTDIHAVGDRAIQLRSNQLHMGSIQRNVAGSNNISERDKMKFQAINTAINTAMQDGSGSEDKGKIRSMIQEIEDPELRRDLEKTSTALLAAHSEKVQPTSKLGKLLSMAKPILSFVLAPIKKVLGLMLTGLKKYWSWTKKMWASGARDIVRGGRQLRQGLFGNREYTDKYGITHAASKGAIRSIGGSILGINRGIISGMPDGLTLTGDAMNLVGGIRNAGSSFITGVRGGQYSDAPSSLPQRGDYGSRQEFNDAMREYRRDSVSSTFGKLGEKLRNSKLGQDVANISESKAAKKFTKMISKVTSGLKKFGSAVSKIASFITSIPGKLAKGAEWLGGKANKFTSWVGKGVQKVEDRIANSAVGNAITQSATFQGAKALVGNVFSAPGRALSGAGQFISGVGAGFRESMAEARRDKQQAKLKAQGPQTIADQETESINRKLENGEGKFFTSVLDLLTSISTNTEKASEAGDESGGSSGGGTQSTENNAGGNNEQEIHTVDIPAGPTNSLGGNMSENAPASYGNSQTDNAGPSPEGGDSGGAKGAGKGIGKMLGGIMSVLGGVMKIVGPVLMAMEGIQMIQKLVQETLTKVLKPLDKIFKKLFKVLSPILDTLTKSLEPLMDCIVTVLDGIITPLAPVIQGIFEAVSPLLEIVAGLVEVIMVPLMAVFDKVLVPIIKQIGSAVKVIMGVVQMGFGAVMVPLGGIMALIGKLPIGGKSIGSKGKEIAQMGKDMIKGGAQMAVEGVKEFVAATLERLTLGIVGGDTEEAEEEKPSNVYQSPDASTYNPGALEGLMASGDSTVVNNYYQNTYGSGNTTYNQHSYSSSGLNMHDHGCGPIALADRVNRSLGGRVDPNALAKSMAASGNYSSTRGTSIAGMLNAGRALGMNMQVGGVTPNSLAQATPNNPITVIGSGIGYGTRDGNNHFMNVLGTNGSGMAYVSNPMTGRVSRTPLNQLALHSKLGLYGSGDIEDNFNFGDAAKSAFSELKNLWTGITNLFNFDSGESQADKMKSSVNKLSEESYINTVKSHYAPAEWQAAYDAYVEANPKEDGESDSDYEHRVNMAVAQQLSEEYKTGVDLDAMTGAVSTFGESLNRYADENVNDNDPTSDYNGMSVSEFVNKTAMAFKAAKDMSYSHGSAGSVTLDDGTVVDNFRPDCSGIISAGIRAMGYGIHGNKSNNFTTFDFYESRGGPRLGGNSVITDSDGNYSDDWEILPISDDAKRRGDVFIAPGVALLNGNQVDGHMNMFIMNRNGTDVGFSGGSGGSGGIADSGAAAEAMLADEENWQDKLPGIQTNKLGIGWVEASDTILRYKGSQMAGIAGNSLNEQMWQWLRFKSGLNLPEKSAAGVIGVWDAEGKKPRMIEGAYSEPEISLAEPLYDLSTGNPDDHPGVFDDYTPEHAAGKNGGYLPNYYAANNHLYPGLGLAQWTAGRGYNLLKFAYENGNMKWYELVPQLNFFKKELDESYTGVKQTLKNGGDTAANMAEAFARQFEGYNEGYNDWSSGIAKRRQRAEEIYSQFRDSKEINPMNQGINSEWDAYMAGMGSQAYKDQLGADPKGGSSNDGADAWKNWEVNAEPVILNSGSSEWADKMKAKYEATIDGKYTHEGAKTVGDIIFDDYVRSMRYPSSLYMGPDKNRPSPLLPPFVGYSGSAWDAARAKLKSYGKDYKDSSGKNFFTAKALRKALYSYTPTQNALEYSIMKNTINPDKDTSNAPYAYMLDLAIGRSAPGYFTGTSDIGPGKLVQDMTKVKEKINKYTDMDNTSRGLRGYNYIYNGNVNNNTISGIPKIYTNDWIDLKHKAEAYTAAGSGDASIMDIPPIDYTDFGFNPSDQYSAQAIPTQYVEINKFNSPTDDQIDRLLAHEFKVSDEKNAEILNKIYAILLELNGGKEGAPTTDGGIPIDQMFNNEIPESIYRLSRG